jgi:hypothetical protein
VKSGPDSTVSWKPTSPKRWSSIQEGERLVVGIVSLFSQSSFIISGLSDAADRASDCARTDAKVTLVRITLGNAITIEGMRYYTITMMNGFSTFKCPLCKHSVTTRDFSSHDGNCRTQAAVAMNKHATATHGRPIPMSPRGARMWHAQ